MTIKFDVLRFIILFTLLIFIIYFFIFIFTYLKNLKFIIFQHQHHRINLFIFIFPEILFLHYFLLDFEIYYFYNQTLLLHLINYAGLLFHFVVVFFKFIEFISICTCCLLLWITFLNESSPTTKEGKQLILEFSLKVNILLNFSLNYVFFARIKPKVKLWLTSWW